LPKLPPAARFVIAGFVVAGIAYLLTSLGGTTTAAPTMVPEPVVAVPELDHKVLSTARDDTREHRLLVEPEPLRHLLATAIDVGPTVANALGMPTEPVPLDELRKARSNTCPARATGTRSPAAASTKRRCGCAAATRSWWRSRCRRRRRSPSAAGPAPKGSC
jgi:hypothetical protein